MLLLVWQLLQTVMTKEKGENLGAALRKRGEMLKCFMLPSAPVPRQVAVALPFWRDEAGAVHICLVTSRKHDGKYVLPKGGVEKSDSDSRHAAIREMWEEGER